MKTKSKTTTYSSWSMMRHRCTNPKRKDYRHYGGRGISYDPRWEKFENFLADMGERPEGKTIDRVNNDGDYTKGNCKWSTMSEQANNKRDYRKSKNSSSKYKYVCFRKSKNTWRAIKRGKEIGNYATEKEAYEATVREGWNK